MIVRVIDVALSPGGLRVTLAEGDRFRTVKWAGPRPQQGAIFEINAALDETSAVKLGGPATDMPAIGGDVMRWRTPEAQHRSRMDVLRDRHTIRSAIRNYFDSADFIEIDAPLLVRGTTPDTGIVSFTVGDRYLVTSTEYQIKRLIVGGFDKVYTLTQNFRAGDLGPRNNPEFTMLEWGRAGADLRQIEEDVECFVHVAHTALGGTGKLDYQGRTIDLRPPWPRIPVADAIARHTGVVLPDFSIASLQRATVAAGITVRDAWKSDRELLFSLLIDDTQRMLGFERPVFLVDWPSFQASSAVLRPGTDIANRSELILGGLELSDGFPFLTDPTDHHERFMRQQKRRVEEGHSTVSLDDRYLGALGEGLPRGAGMALGFDRLVMVLTNQTEIRPTLAFDWTEA